MKQMFHPCKDCPRRRAVAKYDWMKSTAETVVKIEKRQADIKGFEGF